jgi:hypothetical protein
MNLRRLTASFLAATAATLTIGTAVAAADSTGPNKVGPTVHASPATVCTPYLGVPHNQGLGQPCRHHHH